MTMTDSTPARYKTDFNDVDSDGFVTALPGWGGALLVPREDVAVELFDGDENTCIGLVDHVDDGNGLIYVKPLWDTWSDGARSTMPDLGDALIEAMQRVADRRQATSTEPALR